MKNLPRSWIRQTPDFADRERGLYERGVKPGLDVAAGATLSVVTAPIVLVLATLAAIAFGGFGIERETRVGRYGATFPLYRIRSQLAHGGEPGRVRQWISGSLRRWSFNELPQIWNVAMGHMSLVGPRPIKPDQAASLTDWQQLRHQVRPGITGLWQVEARGDGRRLPDNIHFDIQYIDQLSLGMDLRILIRTVAALATRREGVMNPDAGRRRLREGIPHLRLIVADVMLWILAIPVAVYLRHDFSLGSTSAASMTALALLATLLQLVWGGVLGMYRGRWRVGSFEEVAPVVLGSAVVTGSLVVSLSLIGGEVPRGAAVGAGAIFALGSLVARYSARIIYTWNARSSHQRDRRLIVFGAGKAGEDAVEAIWRDKTSNLEPVAFLDDDLNKRNTRRFGLPVVSDSDGLISTARRYGADCLLVAMPSATSQETKRIADLGRRAGLQVEVLPPLAQSLSVLLVEHARSQPAQQYRYLPSASTKSSESSRAAPASRQFDLAVIGLGYVGLPAAIEATRAGMSVAGLDIDPGRVEELLAGRSYIEDIADAALISAISGGFSPTTDPAILAEADVITISVPTPLRNDLPDLSSVIAAAEAVADHLNRGQTIVLESTTYPGTTDEVVRPVLEKGSGLTAGVDFFLAYSPERIDPGNTEYGIHNTPKLVGGYDDESTERAAQLYRKFAPVVTMTGTREAEMAKLLENTYRHVNIALVNEMAIFCRLLGVDIWETIRGAATKPFGFQAFYPGPGVGGHCIPIDPNYLSFRVRELGEHFRFIELAQEINDYMPRYVAERSVEKLVTAGKNPATSAALLLGVSYKPNVGDTRETTATALTRALRSEGMTVSFVDPHVAAFEVDGFPLVRHDDIGLAAEAADIVIVHTPHAALDIEAACRGADLVFDTRGVVDPDLADRL